MYVQLTTHKEQYTINMSFAEPKSHCRSSAMKKNHLEQFTSSSHSCESSNSMCDLKHVSGGRTNWLRFSRFSHAATPTEECRGSRLQQKQFQGRQRISGIRVMQTKGSTVPVLPKATSREVRRRGREVAATDTDIGPDCLNPKCN